MKDSIQKLLARRWLAYLVKGYLLLGVLYLFARVASSLPGFVVAIFWAVLAAVAAAGFSYHVVVRKLHRQLALKGGGRLSRINNGRTFWLIVGFVVSAVCAAGLVLEAPRWDADEWVLVALSVPLFLGVAWLVRKALSKELEPQFVPSAVAKWSGGIVGVLLCTAYAVLLFAQPAMTFGSAADAFLAADQPFASSSSPLLAEAGKLTALIDGFTMYGMAKTAEVSFGAYLFWHMALSASALFGVAGLLSVCYLRWSELRTAFLPLESIKTRDGHGTLKRYAALAAALPVCLVAVFLAADFGVGKAMETGEYTAAERFVQDQVDLAVYLVDGKYYEQRAFDDLMATAAEQSEALAQTAEEILVPLINQSFDARIANVDSYLDWYYSLPADYERLAKLVTGSVEDYAAEQFQAKIEEGVDDSSLDAQAAELSARAEALDAEFKAQLAECEVADVPEWLLAVREMPDVNVAAEPLEPTQKLIEVRERWGISGAAGAAGGFAAKKLVAKVVEKQFFGKIVGRIAGVLGSRGAGAAAGAAAGTAVAPGIGTVAGLAAGTALGVGVDYGLLKIDELQNRETYRQEIVDTIEEQRAEMLASVQRGG